MKIFQLVLAVLILWSCNSCDDSAAPKSRFDKISTAYCECTAKLAAINREAQAADPAQLNDFFQKMQAEYKNAKECTGTIIGQFGHLNAAEMDSVNQLLKTQCPELADKPEQLRELLGQ